MNLNEKIKNYLLPAIFVIIMLIIAWLLFDISNSLKTIKYISWSNNLSLNSLVKLNLRPSFIQGIFYVVVIGVPIASACIY